MDIEEVRIVKNVLKNCMGLRKNERLLLVTDDSSYNLAKIFYSGAKEIGYEPVLLKYYPRQVHGEEPPVVVGDILEKSDVALLITTKSLSHTQARKRASVKGVRIASLPEISLKTIKRTLSFDYRKIERRIKNLALRLTQARRVRVKSRLGTDITFSIKGRKGFADAGIYKDRGAFGNLPAGEVCIAPLEGTAEGVIVIDASIAGLGKLKKPVALEIKKGYLVKSRPKKFENYLSQYGKKSRNLAEFGIGMNPVAKITGSVLEDEKVKDTCHFAFGTNISFGGNIDAGVHIDAVLTQPEIYIEGRRLPL